MNAKMERFASKERVHCTECRHLRSKGTTHKCAHPENWKDTWFEPVRERPDVLNANNDCGWFEPKGVQSKGKKKGGTRE